MLLQAEPRVEAGGRVHIGFEQDGEMAAQMSGERQMERGEFRVIHRPQEQQRSRGRSRFPAKGNDELPPGRERCVVGPCLIEEQRMTHAANRIEANTFKTTKVLLHR
jgi:hypothetical protein